MKKYISNLTKEYKDGSAAKKLSIISDALTVVAVFSSIVSVPLIISWVVNGMEKIITIYIYIGVYVVGVVVAFDVITWIPRQYLKKEVIKRANINIYYLIMCLLLFLSMILFWKIVGPLK